MDIQKLYKTIFPIGGVDDNNKYIDLPGDKINTVQLIEPTKSVKEFLISPAYYKGDFIPIYKFAYRIPLVSINDYMIDQTSLCKFSLDYSGFLPMVTFEFIDNYNSILSTNVPKDGSIIKVYIGGNGDELYYKPIRQDFILTSIRKIAGGDQNKGNVFRYRVYGKLNVPYGYRKESWCSGECTAMQALFNIAAWIGLGFATNFTKTNTLDKMNWRNDENSTYFDFIENITTHACYSPNTFFTSFIDQYNVLNFVECHSLLSHGGKKTDTPAMIYNTFPPDDYPKYNPDTPKTTLNQLPIKEGTDPMNNKYQRLSYYFISNNEIFDSWTNCIEEYQDITNSNSSISEGFKTHVVYSDSNVDNWGSSICDFLIRPIDNLKRDPTTQKIQSIPIEPDENSYIPLNLMQMSNKDYLAEQSGVDNMTNVESFNNFGEVDTSNMFKQYYFAEVQNRYQMKCLKKCGLKVRLQNYNPAITKFSRIWVDIYEKNRFSSLKESTIYDSDKKFESNQDYLLYKQNKNEDILSFPGEASKDKYGTYNRGLSGWYVVTEMEIYYDAQDNNLKMNLTLNRIEYKPCFKEEYVSAKKAIDKYKEENVITDILLYK